MKKMNSIGQIILLLLSVNAIHAMIKNYESVVQPLPMPSSPPNTSIALPMPVQQGVEVKGIHLTTHFDRQQLKNNAEVIGYGYKTSNLKELVKVAHDAALKEELGEYNFMVPEFAGVTSPHVLMTLKKNDVDVHTRWDKIIEQFVGQKEVDALNNKEMKELPQGFVKAVTELADEIKVVFENLAEKAESRTLWWRGMNAASLFSFLFSSEAEAKLLDSSDVKDLLKLANKNAWRLMVRSTGKEDTEELANAGGNESVANVAPTKGDVLRAIGRVVSSYFRPKSLNQRLGAHDKTLFSRPLMPALLQRMIGEKRGGTENVNEIPVGCVVYSQEAEGKTEDVAVLQCGFGHPEGVVESSVPVDTLYVDGNENIYSVIKGKTVRLVPVENDGKLSLQRMQNPDQIQKNPVLPNGATIAIKRVAQAVHDYYGKPMDLELVYEPEGKTVFVVQARPIVIGETALQPSYLADLTQFKPESVVYCSSVSVAGGAVRRITLQEQVIAALTLDDALTIYLNQAKTPDRTKVIGVVVQEEAESTSHAAAVFRGDSKMILRSDEKDKVEKWLQNDIVSLVFDPQNGVVINLSDNAAELDIKQGWLTHPLPDEVSIGQNMAQTETTLRGEMLLPLHSLKDLVEELKEATPEVATKALKTIFAELPRIVGEFKKENPSVVTQQAIVNLENVIEHANSLVPELVKSFKFPPRDIRRLLPINFLEAVLFQKPSKTIVASYSYKSIVQKFNDQKKFIAEKKPSETIMQDAALFDCAYEGVSSAISHELENRWLSFVHDLARELDSQQLNEFKFMVSTIETLDMMPSWLHFIFAPVEKAHSRNGAVKIYEELSQQFESNKQFISGLRHQKNALDSCDSNQFQDPKKFTAAFKQLNEFVDYYSSDDFTKIFKNIKENQLAVVAALPVMKDFVELFDQSIKALKSNGNYGLGQQILHCKQMLTQYMLLLKTWAPLIPEGVLNYFVTIERTLGVGEWPQERYLKQLESTLNDINQVSYEQLQPSQGFNVQAASLGSATNFAEHLPKTLEDVFTTIHQSLLVTMGAFNRELPRSAFKVPALFQAYLYSLGNMKYLSGVRLEKGNFVYTFNFPIRWHSAALDIGYDKNEHMIALQFKFYGIQSGDRWEDIGNIAQIVSGLYDLQIKNMKVAAQGVSFTIFTSDKNQLNLLKQLLHSSIEYTYHAAGLEKVIKTFLDEYKSDTAGNILSAIQKLLESPFLKLRLLGALLYMSYGKQVLETASIIKVATEAYNTGDLELCEKGLELYKALFAKGQGFPEALKTAAAACKNNDIEGLELYKALVEKGQGFDEALQAAGKVIKVVPEIFTNQYSSVRKSALELYKALVEKGQSFDAALQAAAKSIKSDDRSVRLTAVELYQALFSKDQGFDEALQAAAEAINSDNWDLCRSALELYKTLVEKGQGLDKAQDALDKTAWRMNWTHAWINLNEALQATPRQKMSLQERLMFNLKRLSKNIRNLLKM